MIVRQLILKLGFKGDISKLSNFNKGVDNLKASVLTLSAAFGIATTALGYFINEAAKMERVNISFKILAKGITIGKKLLKDVLEFAAVTPFEIPGVLATTKSLLGFGTQAEEMVEIMTEIGDVAAGMDKPLDVLAQSYGRVVASGRLLGRVLYNLRLQGIPITEYLLKVMGQDTPEALDKLVASGKVTSDIFIKAWAMMRKERFFNVLYEQAQTFLGVLSNIKDQITLLSIAIGNNFLPEAKKMANILYYFLKQARVYVETSIKFKNNINLVTKVLELLRKGFVRLFFRIKETIEQVGGLTRVLKVLGVIAGVFVGTTTLKILGWIAKISITFLSAASLKLMLLGVLLATIIVALEDITGYLYGRESITGNILDALEKRYPNALKAIIASVNQLKEAWKGLTLFLYGLFTGNIGAMEAGYEQMFGGLAQKQAREQLAFKKLAEYKEMKILGEAPEVRKERIAQATRYAAQISERQYRGTEYEQAVKDALMAEYTRIGEEERKTLPWYQQMIVDPRELGKEIIEKERGKTLRTLGIGFLRKEYKETTPLSESILEELSKRKEREPIIPYTPFGAEAKTYEFTEKVPVKKIMETARLFEKRRGLAPRVPEMLAPRAWQRKVQANQALSINMPTTIHFERVPPGLTPEQVIPVIEKIAEKEFHKNFNNVLRTNWSAIQQIEE